MIIIVINVIIIIIITSGTCGKSVEQERKILKATSPPSPLSFSLSLSIPFFLPILFSFLLCTSSHFHIFNLRLSHFKSYIYPYLLPSSFSLSSLPTPSLSFTHPPFLFKYPLFVLPHLPFAF